MKNKQLQKDLLNILYFFIILIIGALVMIGLVLLLVTACEYDLSLNKFPSAKKLVGKISKNNIFIFRYQAEMQINLLKN